MFDFLFLSICKIVHFLKDDMENVECRRKYKNPNGLTYIDTKGKSRLNSNDKLVFYTHDKNGDYVIEDVSGHIYKNFSEEARKEIRDKKCDLVWIIEAEGQKDC